MTHFVKSQRLILAQSSITALSVLRANRQLLATGNRYMVKGRATNQLNQLALTSDMPIFNPNAKIYIRCTCSHGDDVQHQGFEPWGSDRAIPSELITSKVKADADNDCLVCQNKGVAVIDYGCYKLLVDPIGLTGKYDKERVGNKPKSRFPRFPRKPRK
jgi:hypothetical protein